MFSTALFATLCLGLQSGPAGRIVIDGRFDEWAKVPLVLTDPADAPKATVDFGEVRIIHDGRFVHLLVDFGKVINVQKLDGTATLLLDCDGSGETGRAINGLPGVDVIVDLTPASRDGRETHSAGIGLRSTTYKPDPADPDARWLSPYDIGFTFGPTYASDRFEFRMKRGASLPGTASFLTGDKFTAKLLFRDRAGRLKDETGAFSYALAPVEPTAKVQALDPLRRAGEGGLRIVSWNVEDGGVLRNPEPFARVLAALDPDIILFQELTDRNTAAQIKGFLDRRLGRGEPTPWNVVFGAGGGRLRCAIASRADLRVIEPLNVIWYPDWADHALRAVGAIVERAGTRLLIVSVHLRSGGRAGNYDDRTRQVEADSIRRAIQSVASVQPYDGLIVAGDINLVGSRQPLDLMAEGLDADGSALAVAEAYQLDGLSNATWSDPDQPFVPGRLDYLLYSDASLKLSRAFILDSSDLSPRWRTLHNLRGDDTASASDHLPLVADVQWIERSE